MLDGSISIRALRSCNGGYVFSHGILLYGFEGSGKGDRVAPDEVCGRLRLREHSPHSRFGKNAAIYIPSPIAYRLKMATIYPNRSK